VRRTSALLNPALGCLHTKCWPGNAECFHDSRHLFLSQRNYPLFTFASIAHVPNLGPLSTAIVITAQLFETIDDAIHGSWLRPIYTFLSQQWHRSHDHTTPLYVTRATKTLASHPRRSSFQAGGELERPACRRLLHFTQSVSNDRAFSLVELEFGDTPLYGIPLVLLSLLGGIIFFSGGGDYTISRQAQHSSRERDKTLVR
jgi:hypothetical protein